MLKICDVLALPVRAETNDLWDLKGFYYDHVPELQLSDSGDLDQGANTRVIIKTHAEHDFDSRRFWRIQSVWLDGQPAMITQNAGREGDDYSERFIIDNATFTEMLRYLFTLRRTDTVVVTDKTPSMDEDLPTLGSFYGHSYQSLFGSTKAE